MENRSHTILVFSVIAVLIVALVAYIVWASPSSGHRKRHYDIFFGRSVAGLQEKSSVSLAGVPVGRVRKIQFDPHNPGLVRVRITIIDPKAPILQGTVAELKHDLFGTATLILDPGAAGSPPILPARGLDVAVIPAKKVSSLIGDPVSIVETLSRTTDRLNQMLSPAGQKTITQEIASLERKSAELADRAPALADKLANTHAAIRSGATMAEEMGKRADAMDRKIQSIGHRKTGELRASLQSAQAGLERLDAGVNAARPAVKALTGPALEQQVRGLRESAAGFGSAAQKIEAGGVGSAMSPPKLPDYQPGH